MQTATPKQIIKILDMIKSIPREQVQAALESGLVADVFFANYGEGVDREAVRRLLGFDTDWVELSGLPPCISAPSPLGIDGDGWQLEGDSGGPPDSPARKLKIKIMVPEDPRFFEGSDAFARACIDLSHSPVWFACQHYAQLFAIGFRRIPDSWRRYHILFPGTVWRDSHDRCHVPCLSWSANRGAWFGRMQSVEAGELHDAGIRLAYYADESWM